MRALSIALTHSVVFSWARVAWIPATFNPEETTTSLVRASSIISRDSSAVSCGPSFAEDFTCPSGTQCLAINATGTFDAVLCCPHGQDCQVIQPVGCDQSLQDATSNPTSQLHAKPVQNLTSCGSACCPMGYKCKDDRCFASPSTSISDTGTTSTAGTSATSLSLTVHSASTLSGIAAAASTTESTSSTSTALAGDPAVIAGSSAGSSSVFSGTSFAAGFAPGVFVGALLCGALFFYLLCKKTRQPNKTYVDNEKGQLSSDTLTDLGTLSARPTMHGRSISGPITEASAGHRTEFLRTTPPQHKTYTGPENRSGYSVEVTGPGEPITPCTPKAVKALFSRSPFIRQSPSTPLVTQPPLPSHLKRGTLSFKISPVRALRRQKSRHSLRGYVREGTSQAASRTDSRRRRPAECNRNGSTETVEVLMVEPEPFTPDQRAKMSQRKS
ncbi:hypothetical protein BTJ68_12656 [Hortaea werneckii EXF-2000]|uniref:Mid2 domain-containing protein n=1 Tax=Hortaea werneckii EXF-2000 TaxID=1157616 RepID=A0A1Z5SRT0_HORWE|nr:hypothetical protein BTJ68_12656 [Hortaea werneckii EXF-2000]